MRQQLLKDSRKSSRKRVDDLKKQQERNKSKNMLKTQQVDERCMNSNQLSIKTTCVKTRATKSRFIYSQSI
jgi:hypothetical protein